jgi:DNA replication protein DnaC
VACEICGDSGWRPIEVDGVRRVTRCDCWRRSLNDKLLAGANIKVRYQHCALDNFVTYENETLEHALAVCRRFASDYPSRSARAPFLVGPPGVGKSHLASGLLKELVRTRGVRGLFYETSELLRLIRTTYDRDARASEAQVLDPIMTADVLVLDDIGRERITDWVDETMNLIVNRRYSNLLPTIFTSNYEDRPDFDDPDTLICRIGHRMLSRMHEMCEFVDMEGADYRLRQPQDGAAELKRNREERRMQPKFRPSQNGRQLKARLRPSPEQGKLDLNWPGGKAGNS